MHNYILPTKAGIFYEKEKKVKSYRQVEAVQVLKRGRTGSNLRLIFLCSLQGHLKDV